MDARTALKKLVRQSAASWKALTLEAFDGRARLETGNSIYVFEDGVMLGKATKASASNDATGVRMPTEQVRLVGFLAHERGLWSFAPRWRQGAVAVLWRTEVQEEKAFVLTSPTSAFTIEPKTKRSSRKLEAAAAIRRSSRPPTLRKPAPPSMTRILPSDEQALSH